MAALWDERCCNWSQKVSVGLETEQFANIIDFQWLLFYPRLSAVDCNRVIIRFKDCRAPLKEPMLLAFRLCRLSTYPPVGCWAARQFFKHMLLASTGKWFFLNKSEYYWVRKRENTSFLLFLQLIVSRSVAFSGYCPCFSTLASAWWKRPKGSECKDAKLNFGHERTSLNDSLYTEGDGVYIYTPYVSVVNSCMFNLFAWLK